MSYLTLGDNENDDDFAPSLGGMSSNLGSLFGMNAQMDNRAGSNQSLTYTAPKPPRSEKPQVTKEEKKPASAGGVAAAVAISAFKYIGNQYESQGRLGMALLSNYAEKDYKILMYVSKQQPVTTAKISHNFQFNVQPNNYASFHDDQRQAWSILFPSSEQLINFAKQVCLAKYHCQSEYGVISQDLDHGESNSQPMAVGDSVEAKYTGWLVKPQDGALGSVFDSNHNTDKFFRFKTGKGKVIKDWEEGMMGMKKGGKRFMIIPPALAYGSKAVGNRVPANSILSFEVDIVRMKHANPMPQSDPSPPVVQKDERTSSMNSLNNAPSAQSDNIPELPQDTVKERTASLNEQMAGHPSNTGKADILSRMARVGQPMLPVKPTMQPQESPVSPHSVTPEVYNAPNQADNRSVYSNSPGLQSNPVAPPVEYQRIAYSPQNMHATQMPVMQPVMPSNVHYHHPGVVGVNDVSRQAYHPSFQQQYISPGVDILPAILTESQDSNKKLKSLMEKVDEVSEKVGKLKSKEHNEYRQSFDMMDAAQISFNIQRIMQENERVKKQIVDRDKLVQQQSDKITDLMQKNQKLIEESHDQMAKRSSTFNEHMGLTQEKNLRLEQEKLELSNKVSDSASKICELQLALADATDRANSLEKVAKATAGQQENQLRIEQLEKELSASQTRLSAAKSEIETLKVASEENLAAVRQEKGDSDKTQRALESEIESLKTDILESKSRHEEEMSRAQKKYHDDALQRQETVEENWKEKCKNAVARVSKAAEDKIKDLEDENESLAKKTEAFQQKLLQIRKAYEVKVGEEDDLRNRLSELDGVQQKYENLRKQAISMKQQYEDKISELSDKDAAESPEGKIKAVMNRVFQDIRSQIEPDTEYAGGKVHSVVLSVIKSTTLSLLKSEESEEEEESENEESDADEESAEDAEVDAADTKHEAVRLESAETAEEVSPNSVDTSEPVKASSPADNLQRDTGDGKRLENVPEPDESTVTPDAEQIPEKDAVDSDSRDTGDAQNADVKASTGLEDSSVQSSDGKSSTVPAENGDTDRSDRVSLDDSKPTPPPLFDDGDDDDDLDWLS